MSAGCGRSSVEHSTQPHAIHRAAVHAEADDAPRELVHHHEHPVCTQDGRFASKQIDAPQTVLRVPEDREPRRSRRVWFRPVPDGENASHHILVHGNPESQGDLLRDPRATPGRISSFHVDDSGDDLLTGSLRARLRPHRRREQPAIFPPDQRSMEAQERGGFQDDGGTDQPARAHEQRAHAGDEAISEAEVGDRFRERLRISSCCLTRTDSATTARAPPGPVSRATVANRWRNRTARSRMAPIVTSWRNPRNAKNF